jgi:hypothetical protein
MNRRQASIWDFSLNWTSSRSGAPVTECPVRRR